MSFMEQFSSKSKEVTQKAKDVAHQQKVKNQIKQENEKIDLLYQTIGKLYYENETGTIKEPYADIIKTIDLTLGKISEYQENLDAIKAKYVCPKCGAAVTSTMQFCKQCGAKITNFSDK